MENIIEVLLALLSILCIILGGVLHRKTERIKIMENQLSEKKYKAYADIVQIFYDILKDVKDNKSIDNKSNMSKLIESKRDILMYGSDDVIHLFNRWLCASSNNDSCAFKYFLEFILSIRKDMCGNKTKLTEYDIMLNLMQSEKEVKDFLDKHSN